jgi:transmembrane sensor
MQENKEKFGREILLRYLKGTGSDEEQFLIKQWLNNSLLEHELSKESFMFWDEIDPRMDIPGYNGDQILDRIHHKIKIEEAVFMNKPVSKKGLFSLFMRIAAILVIPLLFSSLYFFFQNRSFRNSVSWAEIHAPYGTRTDFNLPDGSKGKLNGGSSLKFPTHFTGKIRDIELSGEAYFEVVSDQRKPFIVSTKNIDVKVTGTSFSVMAFSDEPNTEVTLKNGKVEVLRKKDEITKSIGILKPDEVFIYSSLSDEGKIQSVNSSDRLSWLDGKLTFKYEPFDEVIRKLNRWYNVNIVIKDKSLDSYIYYGTFENETLDEVLKLLQYTAPIKYVDFMREKKSDGTFEKRKIEIYSKK